MHFVSTKLTHFLFLFLLVLGSVLTPDLSSAGVSCKLIHKKNPLARTNVKTWLAWETSVTLPSWGQERPSSPLPIARVSSSLVRTEILSEHDVYGLHDALNLQAEQIPWFKHPYNQDSAVPHYSAPVVETGVAYHTASRTIVTVVGGRLVSLKMATDHPFGPGKDYQPGKVNLDADLKYSVARSQAIAKIDQKIGSDSEMIVQKEIAAVIDKQTGNGYLFRDMSFFEDGRHYLPAHQIPYVGKKIAESKGSNVHDYWSIHWASAIGRYQAKLLYRYGMEVRAVNPQNFLIQLNRLKNPTGVLVWRDLAESHLVKPIAQRLGLQDFIDRDVANGGWGVIQSIRNDNSNIYWRFNDASPTLDGQQMRTWSSNHDSAYRQELESALGIKIPTHISLKDYINLQLNKGNESELLQAIDKWHRDHGNAPQAHFDWFLPNQVAA